MTRKHQAMGKPRYSLFPVKALLLATRAFEFGAGKYSDDHYLVSPEAPTPKEHLEAALRHIYAIQDGDLFDVESGVHHVGHAIARLAMYVAISWRHTSLREMTDFTTPLG